MLEPLSPSPAALAVGGPVTPLQLLSDRLGEHLRMHGYLGMILIDTSPLMHIERRQGSAVYDRLLSGLSDTLVSLRGSCLRKSDILAVDGPFGEQFMVFLSEKRTGPPIRQKDMELVADKIHVALLSAAFDLTTAHTRETPKLNVGFAAAIHNPMLRAERVLYRLISEARQMAHHQTFRFSAKSKEKLRNLIHLGSITTVYQPIVRLKDNEILGYEALTRGPAGSEFQSPIMLFAMAREADLQFELDQLCRKRAIASAASLGPKMILFVNTLPSSIHDPAFRGEYLEALLKDTSLGPSNIVLEVTEGIAIDSHERFSETLDDLRQIGFAIAVDDAGTGYSSLDAIVRLRPNYVKVDMSLVRGIDSSAIKQEVVRSLRSIARTMDAGVVAEGIETEAELKTLCDLEVPFGQGYLFAKPGPAFPALERR